MNVLVTNGKSRIAYNVVKSLAMRGKKVYCADFVSGAMTFYSRYSSGHFLYPSPFRKQEQFVNCLIKQIRALQIDVLIPVFEELFLVSKHKNRIEPHVRMAIPTYEQILMAHNKDQWEPIARQLGIPVPVTHTFNELTTNPSLMGNLTYPILVKPNQGGGGWGLLQVDSIKQLEEILQNGKHNDLPLERFFVQEIIKGQTICVAMVFSNGQLRGKTTYRQIREYPLFSGQATCRISVSNVEAESYLQRLLEHLKWHGVCQVDFVIDNKTRKPYLIDINPRFWGSLAQGIASGVDFPQLICEIAANGDVDPIEGFTEGITTRWLGGELRGFFQHYGYADNKATFLNEFVKLPNETKPFDDFSLRDPLPFIFWGWDSLVRIVKHKSNKPHESLAGVWQ